jgi:hypothetical protein
MGAEALIGQFLNHNLLYAFIIPLKNKHYDIIIKFGFTDDINDRIKTLITEYGSIVYFVGVKKIKSQKKERKFHDLLRTKYPQYIEEYTINGKNKTELYKLCPLLIEIFKDYKDNGNTMNPEKIEISNKQPKYSMDILETMNIVKRQENDFLDYTKEFNNSITKENNDHEKWMKEKEIELENIQLEKMRLQLMISKKKLICKKKKNLKINIEDSDENSE